MLWTFGSWLCLGATVQSTTLNLSKSIRLKNYAEKVRPSFTVQKAGKYPCIKTKSLRFMNILQFLAPGDNLKNFFHAFGVSESKGFFAYEKFSSADMLDNTYLPPYADFWSSIKQCNVLEEEYNTYQKLLDQKGNPSKKHLKLFDFGKYPKQDLKFMHGCRNFGMKMDG